MIIAYKYKLKPSQSQKNLMNDWIAMLRSHYNFCLRDRIDSYEEVKSPRLGNYSDLRTKAQCCPLTCSISKNSSLGDPFKKSGKKRTPYEMQSSELPKLKEARPWYKKIHSTVLQQNLRRLNTAFENFYDLGGYPKFKTRQRFKSFSYPPNQIKLKEDKIYLPSIGWMKLFKSRDIPNGFNLRTVTVRQKANGWYVSIQIEDKSIPQRQSKDLRQVKAGIGCDLGIKKLIALSNGEQIPNPQFEKKLERTKTIRQRRATRKKRASNNQKRAFRRLGRIDQKIVNQREDYQWKVAHRLVRLADVIVLEDLNIQGMIRKCRAKQEESGKFQKNGQSAKKALNRLIRDCSWSKLKLKIQSVAGKFGCIISEVNPKFTSQKCSNCGHIDKENRNKERFLCTNCGFLADADNQAAINIGTLGLEILGISPSKLLGVPQKVTGRPETTGMASNSQEKSVARAIEPTNPWQLTLFEWRNGQAIVHWNPPL